MTSDNYCITAVKSKYWLFWIALLLIFSKLCPKVTRLYGLTVWADSCSVHCTVVCTLSIVFSGLLCKIPSQYGDARLLGLINCRLALFHEECSNGTRMCCASITILLSFVGDVCCLNSLFYGEPVEFSGTIPTELGRLSNSLTQLWAPCNPSLQLLIPMKEL